MKNVTEFLNSFFNQIQKVGLDVSGLDFDHIAYQASSASDYEKQKKEYTELGQLINEEVIGNRRVAVFRLKEPICYKDIKISVIELIEPKQGQVIESGLQHAEFIYEEPFEKMMEKYPEINWDTSSMYRAEFAHLKLNFDNGLTLKFLHAPIVSQISGQ